MSTDTTSNTTTNTTTNAANNAATNTTTNTTTNTMTNTATGATINTIINNTIPASGKPSVFLVTLAYAIVYIVWGSTYFFIQMAVHGFPPMLLGAIRFFTAGMLLLVVCAIKGDRLWNLKDIKASAVSGFLMLFIGTGVVIWVEQTLPSAMVAIMISANPVWFVILDKSNWKVNLKSKTTIGGLVLGFAGVLLLFGQAFRHSMAGHFGQEQLINLLILMLGPIAWSAGSLYSKKNTNNSPARLNTAWQMIISGLIFLPAALVHHEFNGFHITRVPAQAWVAVSYLILFGSIVAFSAYIWLLKIRPATQVSTHSYVNPVIAVLLGMCFANENISALQLTGLVVILLSVLLVNMSKYRLSSVKKKKTLFFGLPFRKRKVCV